MGLVALLNSTLVAFWLRHAGKMQGGQYQVDAEPLLCIPLLHPPPVLARIAEYNLVLRQLGEPTSFWETLVDTLLYEIYFHDQFAADGLLTSNRLSLQDFLEKNLPTIPYRELSQQEWDLRLRRSNNVNQKTCRNLQKTIIATINTAESAIEADSYKAETVEGINAHPWVKHVKS